MAARYRTKRKIFAVDENEICRNKECKNSIHRHILVRKGIITKFRKNVSSIPFVLPHSLCSRYKILLFATFDENEGRNDKFALILTKGPFPLSYK